MECSGQLYLTVCLANRNAIKLACSIKSPGGRTVAVAAESDERKYRERRNRARELGTGGPVIPFALLRRLFSQAVTNCNPLTEDEKMNVKPRFRRSYERSDRCAQGDCCNIRESIATDAGPNRSQVIDFPPDGCREIEFHGISPPAVLDRRKAYRSDDVLCGS